jgi:PIN domain-containing protein
MKPKLYVETTIVGYLTGRLSRDTVTAGHQRTTRQWWKERRHAFELYCSEVVVEEAGEGDKREAAERLAQLAGIPVLDLSPGALALSGRLLKRKAIPARSEYDAFHLAIAAVNKIDYLLTWNCRHLANASLRPFLERICKKAGYHCPIICTPDELLEK